MNIFILSVAVPEEFNRNNRLGIQGQLFLNRLILGIKENFNGNVYPLSFFNNPKRDNKSEKYNDAYSIIYNQKSIKAIKEGVLLFKKLNKNKDAILIVDGLNFKCILTSLLIKLLYKTKSIIVLTDIPRFIFPNSIKGKLISSLNEFLIRKTDGFIFLTEEMNDLINRHNKPNIVIEGFVDQNIINNNINTSPQSNIIMYAGGVKKIYGIENLVQAFIKLNTKKYELHIYGNGDYTNDIIKLSTQYPNIKYKGLVSNSEIIELERKAYILINPRPTSDLYTIYSFPSKTIEYMASGTPFLTTKLKCIPEEYNQYLNYIDGEDVESIFQSLDQILKIPYTTLKEKAIAGKEFIENNKTNTIACRKIVELINML